jgi:hypothetical protein
MKRVRTILAKAAVLAVLGIGLSGCVAAVPEPVPAPAPAVAAAPGYYYPYPGYYYPCCAVVPNVGLSFDLHAGHRFGHR